MSGLRPITGIKDETGLFYSQGHTQVHCTAVPGRPELNYRVSELADRINFQPYRYGRRHYQILDFLRVGYQYSLAPTAMAIRVLTTDGSSRCTALNALTAYLKPTHMPIAISFGLYQDRVVYDLCYQQDAHGAGDCALMLLGESKEAFNEDSTIGALLYEGTMTYQQFITGLTQSTKHIESLRLKLNEL